VAFAVIVTSTITDSLTATTTGLEYQVKGSEHCINEVMS